MANVGVLGAGSWGTALSVLLHDNGHEVTIWSIDQKEVEMLNTKREHEAKLPGVKLAKEIVITNESESCDQWKRFPCSCSSFNIHKVNSKENESLCGRGADDCRCCKRN